MSEPRRISFDVEVTPSVTMVPPPMRRSRLKGLQARLKRGSGTDIMCGVLTCRGKLGSLEWASIAEWRPDRWAIVAVPPGFVPDVDGIWRLSKHARRRRPDRDQRVKQRRPAKVPSNDVMESPPPGTTLPQAVAPPFRIQCPRPRCGFVSIVSWEGLGLLQTE